MKSMQYILARPLALIALLANALHAVLWGFVVEAEGGLRTS